MEWNEMVEIFIFYISLGESFMQTIAFKSSRVHLVGFYFNIPNGISMKVLQRKIISSKQCKSKYRAKIPEKKITRIGKYRKRIN